MRLWKILPMIFLLAGCGTAPVDLSAGGTDQAASLPADPSPAPRPVKLTNGPFTMTIFSPADQSTVTKPQVDLHGELSEAAVLTIDGNTYLIDAGTFTRTISLSEGINTIQIVASDMDGNEVDWILTVIYQA